jgi:hypothetical protein
VEHEGLRFVSQSGESEEQVFKGLMEHVTDNIDDEPLDFFVALRPPSEATIYHLRHTGTDPTATTSEFVIHVQLSPLYPLARERCRMVTPVLHPLVAPLFHYGGEDDEKREVGPLLEGGRMAFMFASTPHVVGVLPRSSLDEYLAQFRGEWLVDPVACAKQFIKTYPKDSTPDVMAWITDSDEMARNARRLVELGGGLRWRPELHAVCPRVFKTEVRTLLLARQRGGNILADMPVEVVWHIINALLKLHLTSGSLLYS